MLVAPVTDWGQATAAEQAQEARDAFDRHGGSDVRAYDRSRATGTAHT
jgi:hypothetical protein